MCVANVCLVEIPHILLLRLLKQPPFDFFKGHMHGGSEDKTSE